MYKLNKLELQNLITIELHHVKVYPKDFFPDDSLLLD